MFILTHYLHVKRVFVKIQEESKKKKVEQFNANSV
mgnify:CR=1 FL=1